MMPDKQMSQSEVSGLNLLNCPKEPNGAPVPGFCPPHLVTCAVGRDGRMLMEGENCTRKRLSNPFSAKVWSDFRPSAVLEQHEDSQSHGHVLLYKATDSSKALLILS
ncbi:hypothetical protein KIL84_003995 [Mauremys mutica]|uniref:Uncharacterized protein n=1 Tax=Mauremys mutica TaxID=74926 RepID=A0A9D3WWT4_9SAUR|nr:hypothetical protein KIL84_003995 [Mauremys mutica]